MNPLTPPAPHAIWKAEVHLIHPATSFRSPVNETRITRVGCMAATRDRARIDQLAGLIRAATIHPLPAEERPMQHFYIGVILRLEDNSEWKLLLNNIGPLLPQVQGAIRDASGLSNIQAKAALGHGIRKWAATAGRLVPLAPVPDLYIWVHYEQWLQQLGEAP